MTTESNISRVLRITLKPSRRLAVSLAALHGLALASACLTLTGWPLYLVAAGVVLSAVHGIGEALQLWPGSPRRLEIHADGRAAWQDGAKHWHDCRIASSTYVSVPLVVLGLQGDRWRARWLALLPDSADSESLRQLRVRIRWPPASARRLIDTADGRNN